MTEQTLGGYVFSTLDAIESACKTTAKAWDKKSKGISVVLYINVIKEAKWSSDDVKDKIALDYINNFNKMLTLLTEAGIESANSFHSDWIPLVYVSECIILLKKSFKEGAGSNV